MDRTPDGLRKLKMAAAAIGLDAIEPILIVREYLADDVYALQRRFVFASVLGQPIEIVTLGLDFILFTIFWRPTARDSFRFAATLTAAALPPVALLVWPEVVAFAR